MTDRELTPAEEEQVRRLLADARHREPVPDDVAARLDHVLVGLAAERGEQAELEASRDEHAPEAVDELAHRRRRRLLGSGLLAAAAVVVAGVSLPSLLQSGSEDGGVAGDSSAMQDSDEAAAPEAGEAPTSATAEQDDAALRRAVRRALGAQETTEPCPRRPAWGTGQLVPLTWEGTRSVVVLRAPDGGRRQADLYSCGSDTLERSTTLRAP